jgi:hypothetical protein
VTAPHLVLGKLVSCNSSDSETRGDLLPGSGCTLSNGTVGGSEGRTVGVT